MFFVCLEEVSCPRSLNQLVFGDIIIGKIIFFTFVEGIYFSGENALFLVNNY